MSNNGRQRKARFDPQSYEATTFGTKRGGQTVSERELSDIMSFLDQNSTILEVGTGPGRITRRMAERLGAKIVGTDVDPRMVKHLAAKIRKMKSPAERRIDLVVASGQDLPFRREVFDKVVCIRVLRYLESPQKAVDGMVSSVKQGGEMILEFANILRPQSFTQLPQYLLHQESYPRLFRKKEVEDLVSSSGVRITSIRGWHMIPPKIFALIDNARVVALLSRLERILQRLLPSELMSRSIVVCAIKD
jgi:ubiquinone/menaquinone biosynthesis C-methylase UbiE